MARIIEDGGATADILKPFKLRWYEPNALPDPVACAGSAIGINDRHDGQLVPRVAVSTGAAWVRLAVMPDLGNSSPIDVTPIVEKTTREEIARALPAIVERAVPALPAPADTSGLVETMLLMNEAIRRLEERLQLVESTAAAADSTIVRIEDIAAA